MRTLGLILFLIAAPALAADYPRAVAGKVVAVAAGDTLTVLDADKVQHKVRLHGIDTPERKQSYGTKARQALADLVFGKQVIVDVVDRDRYKRLVGKVAVDGSDVNRKLVLDGFAWQYRQYDKSKAMADAQAEAQEAKRGLWADPDPPPPWEYRRKK